jgi:hypothetical protein
MFCRIEYLSRDVRRKKRIVFEEHKSAVSFAEMLVFADHQSAARGVAGYRLHDLHTKQVTEAWN